MPPSAVDDEVSDEDEAAEMEDEQVKEEVKAKKKGKKLKLAKEFSDLVTICVSVHFNGFKYAREKCKISVLFIIGVSFNIQLTFLGISIHNRISEQYDYKNVSFTIYLVNRCNGRTTLNTFDSNIVQVSANLLLIYS